MKITKETFKKIIRFIANPRLLLCIGIAWLITNGWSYILGTIGILLNIRWMQIVAGAYLTFLWLPISPEKIVTIAIAILLLRRLFPHDEKTLGVLKELREKGRMKKEELRQRKKQRKLEKQNAKQTKTQTKKQKSSE